MLTNRQFQIFKYYVDHKDSFIPARQIAERFSISIRTVKNEMKCIRDFSEDFSSFLIETVTNRGTILRVLNQQKFKQELNLLQNDVVNVSDSTQSRIQNILKFLLDAKEYVSKYQIMTQFFISESTLYNYMNEIKSLIKKFHLTIIYKTNLGYSIVGKELDKRICIAQLSLAKDNGEHLYVTDNTTHIYNVVADTFVKHHYAITEKTLLNITAHISRTIQRVTNFHFITDEIEIDIAEKKEYEIAREILEILLGQHQLKPIYFQNEALLLAQMIMGKLDYVDNSELQEKINDFIGRAFQSIHKRFFINLDSVDNLKLLLALHLVPLFYRIQSGTQMVNLMASEIHQSFPQAYDIAIYFCLKIEDEFDLTVSEDEIAYLTLYFNYGLESFPANDEGKKVLIITPLRKSETILLKHTILKWFPNQIEEIRFITPDSEDFEFDDYDAVFSTEENLERYHGSVSSISLFPKEKDFKKINLAINGFTDISAIIDKFSEDCFFYGEIKNKKEAIELTTSNAVSKYQLDDDFLTLILDREKIASSYFGNQVAMPHPLTPITEETFVSVALLKKSISWDTNHDVKLVLLVSVAKNNPREFQFWYYLSSFIRNETFLEKLHKKPNFQNFISVLTLSLENEFN